MEELQEDTEPVPSQVQDQHHLNGTQILIGGVAGLTVGAPLLGMMGCTLLASTILVLVVAPLLLVFSPILLPAAFVVAASLAGFGVSAAMAVLGLSAFRWALCYLREGGPYNIGKIVDMLTLSGHRVKEKAMDFDEHHGQYVNFVIPSEKRINGGL